MPSPRHAFTRIPSPRHVRIGLAAIAAIAVALPAAMPVMAAGPEVIAAGPGARLEDAAMSGASLAITWTVTSGEIRITRAITSGAGGAGLTPARDVRLGVDQDDPDAAVCGGYAAIAYISRDPADRAVILALRPDGEDVAFDNDLVKPLSEPASAPSIACIDGDRTIIAWKGWIGPGPGLVWADTGSLDRYWNPPAPSDPVTHGVLWGMPVSPPSAAGSATRGHIATIVGRKVRYVAIDPTGHLPGNVVADDWRVLGGPVDGRSPRGVVAGAAGRTVVVAWTRCDSIVARVSDDEGETFGPARTIAAYPCGRGSVRVRSIAVSGQRIAVGYLRRLGGRGAERLIRSDDRLVTHTDLRLGPPQSLQLTGWLGSAADPSLVSVRGRAGTVTWLPAGSVIP